MTNNNPIQPIFILPEDTKRTSGKDAQHTNIMAAQAVAQTVRSTLGPKGMDKMIVGSEGDITVTNDGVTILREMQIEHPAAKMVVEVAKTQEQMVGDGTTTAVILAGELLKRAEELLEQRIHPTIVAKGYRMAEAEAQRVLHKLSENVTLEDDTLLMHIAMTAMTGKGAEAGKEHLARLLLNAVRHVSLATEKGIQVPVEDITLQKNAGGSIAKSRLIEGVVLDKEVVHSEMPCFVKEAKIALLDAPLEIKNTEIDAKIQITDPLQLNSFLEQEERMLREMVTAVRESGATVLFCQRGVDDLAQHFLAKSGILAVRRVKKSDMEKLARATGGHIVSNWKELSASDLGWAGVVHQERVGEEEMIFVEQCQNPKSVTVLLEGGTDHVVEEIVRAVTDAVGDLAAALRQGKVVAGAGAVEMALAHTLRQYAMTLSGREQLAVKAFADTMEIIPRTLAENAGLDPIDLLINLRLAHDAGEHWAGVDVFAGKVMNAWKEGVIEPLQVKTQALASATEVAEMILRIDDVIMGAKNYPPPTPSMEET